MTARTGDARWGERRAARRSDDRGAVAIIVAVMMLLLMGLAAIVVDLGFARDRARVAQNAADAGALGAAQYLATRTNPLAPTTAELQAASTRAEQYITYNGWPDGGVVTFDQTAYVVTVTLKAEVPRSFFAGALGANGPPVARSAAARWAIAAPPGPCSVCIFRDLQTQNGDISLTNGDIRAGGVITTGPTGNVIATSGNLYAGNVGGSGGRLQPPTVFPQVGAVPDPFIGVPTPPLNVTVAGSPSGNCTPGTYASVDGCDTFARGIYVVTAESRWRGSSPVTGDRVLFYLTCATAGRSAPCNGRVGGSLSSNGGPRAQLTFTPYDDPQYAGLVVFGDRTNTAENDIQGGSEFSTGNGSFYMKAGSLTHGGTPVVRIGGNLVVGSYGSNGNHNPAYVTGTNPSSPPPPANGGIGLVK